MVRRENSASPGFERARSGAWRPDGKRRIQHHRAVGHSRPRRSSSGGSLDGVAAMGSADPRRPPPRYAPEPDFPALGRRHVGRCLGVSRTLGLEFLSISRLARRLAAHAVSDNARLRGAHLLGLDVRLCHRLAVSPDAWMNWLMLCVVLLAATAGSSTTIRNGVNPGSPSCVFTSVIATTIAPVAVKLFAVAIPGWFGLRRALSGKTMSDRKSTRLNSSH